MPIDAHRMNILAVSHSSVVPSYQEKLKRLAQYPGVTVTLVIPPRWKEGGRDVEGVAVENGAFRAVVIPAFRIGRLASYCYHPGIFRRTVSSIAPTIAYVEEEPWSVAAWQVLRAAEAQGAKMVFFTWENIWKGYKYISERILSRVVCRSSGAVAGNPEAESILRRRGFTNPILQCPQYGVDPVLFRKKDVSIPSPLNQVRPVIAYIGRLEREKGIHLLLEAAAAIPGDWSLLLIGSGHPATGDVRGCGAAGRTPCVSPRR